MVYRPTARVLTVLELLQSHGRMTGAELAQRLEVNIRTLRDYIEMLGDLGIPVEAKRGRNGAYWLRPGYKLPPLIFTEDESLALTLALLIAKAQGFAQASAAFEGVLAKVMRVLPEATRTQVQAVEQTVLFDDDAFRIPPSLFAVTALSSAFQAGRRVQLHYRSQHGEVTKRGFDPYGVVSRNGIWYTLGYCQLRQGQRLFRLDRIVKVEIADETFSPPAHFDIREAVKRALTSIPNEWQTEVWLKTTLPEAQRSLSLARVFFEEKSGGVLVRAEVDDLSWVAQKLAGLGIPFVIHRPHELRVAVSQYAQKLANYAQQTSMEGIGSE
ncbi:transcriptional regulator [Reticulibacter mediterranei]|uniref:Transcriptional regulator n=1 Tax=Reticulibacter mediterranei TaxID=2778369 RepID=A0A8J3N418_9CHLR|nr:YafY family protein [Reticulibacter mediterranei]GHO97702.1 transcriptional regulator [Reticulibacter mediterranei]